MDFDELQAIYDELSSAIDRQGLQRADCGKCQRCCTGPPFYMTLSDIEYEYAMQTAPAKRVTFQPLVPGQPDPRHAYRTWTCPFLSRTGGCTVYEKRPLACRVFGPMAQEPIPWDFCVFKRPKIYRTASEIPIWTRYNTLLNRYPSQRGYVKPVGMFHAPTVELLQGMHLPWAVQHHPRIEVPWSWPMEEAPLSVWTDLSVR